MWMDSELRFNFGFAIEKIFKMGTGYNSEVSQISMLVKEGTFIEINA